VLRAVRDVNQLIVREKDPGVLIQAACASLVQTRGYASAWIALEGIAGHELAHAGLGDAAAELAALVEQGSPPACYRAALDAQGIVSSQPGTPTCSGCALECGDVHVRTIAVRLEHESQVYGVLSVCLPRETEVDHEERRLLADLADDLAYALHSMRLAEERERAQRALVESEERYRTLFNGAGDAIFIHDLEGRLIEANRVACERLGYAREELLRMAVADIEAPEYAAQIQQRIQLVRQQGHAVLETVQQRRDGTLIPTELNVRRIIVDGEPAILSVARDITERKRREAEIRRQNRELTLLNRVIAATAAGQDAQAILHAVCRELALAFDVPQAAAILVNEDGRTASVVSEYLAEDGPPIQGERIPLDENAALVEPIADGEPILVDGAQSDPRLQGVEHLIRRLGIASALLLPLYIEGEPVGGLALATTAPRHFEETEVRLARRVTEQVSGALARARLAGGQRRLTTVIEQSPDSTVITDTDARILYVNPAFEQITGYSQDEALGHKMNILRSGKHDDAFYRDLWETISSGEVWHGRLVNRRKDGSLYTEDAIISPVRDREGRIVNYVAVKRDVTRELDLEERYRQAQKMEAIGRLAGGVAHDFNNLLTAIQGYAQFLLDDLASDDPTTWPPGHALRADLGEILRASDRATALTRQLLALSRRQVLQPRTLDLNTVLADMEKMLRRLIGEDIELRSVLAPDLGAVRADPGQIEQVIMNLAVNARDAMPSGGSLTFETANVSLDESYAEDHPGVKAGDYVQIAVSDTGMGMTEEVKIHLFEPFFTTKARGKGTGLGLATVYGIVEQSGGHIEVYSELGMGTTFKVYFPRVDERADVASQDSAPKALPAGSETILLVEDEALVRQPAVRILEQSGYRVLEAGHPDEAIALAEIHRGTIHMLVTDVIMPTMNGRELAERIRRSRPDIQVLYISGYTDATISQHGVLDEGITLLQKPFSPSALAVRVREMLDAPS